MTQHKYLCVVHKDRVKYLSKKCFHTPPKSVTEDNSTFFGVDYCVKGSICKSCYSNYLCRPKEKKDPKVILKDERNVSFLSIT